MQRDDFGIASAAEESSDIEDDRLRLIFTCCHPALAPATQVALTLREVCGLTTEEIGRAFLTSPTTIAQRIVRGKAKIRDAGIPYEVPAISIIPERLDSVLSVIYLVFNEGYSASSGDTLTRADLSDEAIRLARLLLELMPDPEVMGLLALMLVQESRRESRVATNGDLILLEDQNRDLWNHDQIQEGKLLVEQSLASRNFGIYTIKAAIAAVSRRRQNSGRDGLVPNRRTLRTAAQSNAITNHRIEPRRRRRHAGRTCRGTGNH